MRVHRKASPSLTRCKIPSAKTSSPNTSGAWKMTSASQSISRRLTRLSAAAASNSHPNADRAVGDRICRTLWAKRATGGVDHLGGRPRDAGFRFLETWRQVHELSARVRGRWRRTRPLFDYRARSGSDLAHEKRQSRNQSFSTSQSRRLHTLPRTAATSAARVDRGKQNNTARGFAPHGGRRVRLSRVRHGAADGGSGSAEPGPDRNSRCDPGSANDHRRLRCGEGLNYSRHTGAARERR